jgi:mannose-6-phosphate isomerase-like protein (cupin superfamily)
MVDKQKGIEMMARLFRISGLTLLAAGIPSAAQFRNVLKSAEIEKVFAAGRPSQEVLTKTNFGIDFRSTAASSEASAKDAEADEFWFVRHGAAQLSLNSETYQAAAGDVVHVARNVDYRIANGRDPFQYVAVRVFPETRPLRIGYGAGPTPRTMPVVVPKKQIEETFATAEKNVTLHSAGAALINHVVYPARHGPWEVHQTCDDIYFVRLGTAHTRLDGRLVNPKDEAPGEPRGTGVIGAREFTISAGDMVFIPRNMAHFSDPGSGKVGYLLLKVCD